MNLTRLKIGKMKDEILVVLPRGSYASFKNDQMDMAKLMFNDISRYGKDCVWCGMLWGSAVTIAGLVIARKIRAKKVEEKEETNKEVEV